MKQQNKKLSDLTDEEFNLYVFNLNDHTKAVLEEHRRRVENKKVIENETSK